MADLVIIYWKEIPAQVKARNGRQTLRRELSARFAEAIDMAAMRCGDKDTDTYLAGWRTSDPVAINCDAETAIEQTCAVIEREWDDSRLTNAIAGGGHEWPKS